MLLALSPRGGRWQRVIASLSDDAASAVVIYAGCFHSRLPDESPSAEKFVEIKTSYCLYIIRSYEIRNTAGHGCRHRHPSPRLYFLS